MSIAGEEILVHFLRFAAFKSAWSGISTARTLGVYGWTLSDRVAGEEGSDAWIGPWRHRATRRGVAYSRFREAAGDERRHGADNQIATTERMVARAAPRLRRAELRNMTKSRPRSLRTRQVSCSCRHRPVAHKGRPFRRTLASVSTGVDNPSLFRRRAPVLDAPIRGIRRKARGRGAARLALVSIREMTRTGRN
jgi:hypothetical protein